MHSVCLWLPFPPSVNGLYPGKARRFKSRRYRNWIHEADVALLQQDFKPVEGMCEVHYKFGRPDARKRDVFNFEKALTDYLVSAGVIEDDSLIERGTVEWAAHEGVTVEVWPI